MCKYHNYRCHGIIIELEEDHFGNLILTPRNKKLRAAIRKYMRDNNYWGDDYAYLQTDYEQLAAYKDFNLSKSEIHDLQQGWPIAKKIDAWLFLQGYIGFDAGDRMPAW